MHIVGKEITQQVIIAGSKDYMRLLTIVNPGNTFIIVGKNGL